MSFESRHFSYELDARDCVVAVCRDWDALATAFSALGPRARELVGTPIHAHITGKENRHIFELLFGRSRAKRVPLAVPFRCDGPAVRRFMRLEIEPLAAGGLRVTSITVREEPRAAVALLDAQQERSEELLTICAWCKQVKSSAHWVEVEVAIRELGLFEAVRLPQLTHGMCPACAAQVQTQLDALG